MLHDSLAMIDFDAKHEYYMSHAVLVFSSKSTMAVLIRAHLLRRPSVVASETIGPLIYDRDALVVLLRRRNPRLRVQWLRDAVGHP